MTHELAKQKLLQQLTDEAFEAMQKHTAIIGPSANQIIDFQMNLIANQMAAITCFAQQSGLITPATLPTHFDLMYELMISYHNAMDTVYNQSKNKG